MRKSVWEGVRRGVYVLGGVLILFAGCSTNGIRRPSHFSVADGVDRKEALWLARETLTASDFRPDYHADQGEILYDVLTKGYSDYWFVVFPARRFDDTFWNYLVVIRRKDGTVIFQGPYVPYEVVDYEWVFRQSPQS